MLHTVRVPTWLFSRRAARKMLVVDEIPASLTDAFLVLRCDVVERSTWRAADEVVKQVLVERDAIEMVVVGGTAKFVMDLLDSGVRRGVVYRIDTVERAEQLAGRLGWRLKQRSGLPYLPQ